jgi:DNA polymerase kappa
MKEHAMSAWDIVARLRAEVEASTDLTISAGIAPNRMLAKVRLLASYLTLDLLG